MSPPSEPRRVVIASRGSKLALRQTEMVADMVRAARPGIEVAIATVTTTGDRDPRPFRDIGGKGLFTSEVEREVAEGRADLAVHSAKDLTAELAPGCRIVCVPRRAAVHDVVVGGRGGSGEERLGSLASDAAVGTSSLRRRALLREARPDLRAVELRGNLDTRLRKIDERPELAAGILAAAGLERLGSAAGAPLEPSWWVPAPGQGALAIEARAERADLGELLAPLEDPAARAELACERAFAAALEGGCSVPLGCLARVAGGRVVATGYLGDPDGGHGLRDRVSGHLDEASALGAELAHAILGAGGAELLEDIRATEAPGLGAP